MKKFGSILRKRPFFKLSRRRNLCCLNLFNRDNYLDNYRNKEALTEDEGDFLTRCLEAYRIQKEKWKK